MQDRRLASYRQWTGSLVDGATVDAKKGGPLQGPPFTLRLRLRPFNPGRTVGPYDLLRTDVATGVRRINLSVLVMLYSVSGNL